MRTEETGNARQFELGKGRIEALSDGIFAIAMTLLVFNFKVPDLPHGAANVMVAPAILRLWPQFATYFVSFASLGVFWIGHHNIYHVVRRSNRTLLALNIAFFMSVSLVPFSTSLLNAFEQTQAALLFFGCNLTLIGLLLFLQWFYAATQDGMIVSELSSVYRRHVRNRLLAYPAVVTCTMILCFWSVSLSLIIYLSLLPLYLIPGGIAMEAAQDAGAIPIPGAIPAEGNSSGKPALSEDAAAIEGMPSRIELLERKLRRANKTFLLAAVAVAAIAAGWIAFRPDLIFIDKRARESRFTADRIARGGILESGVFHGVAHQSHGVATVFLLADGSRALQFTRFQTSNGPDVHVLLIETHDADDNATVAHARMVELGQMKGNLGDQVYSIPEQVDLSRFHAVTLWCERFHVNFATAPLMAVQPVGGDGLRKRQ
jgi:uncharacterized membrane protein